MKTTLLGITRLQLEIFHACVALHNLEVVFRSCFIIAWLPSQEWTLGTLQHCNAPYLHISSRINFPHQEKYWLHILEEAFLLFFSFFLSFRFSRQSFPGSLNCPYKQDWPQTLRDLHDFRSWVLGLGIESNILRMLIKGLVNGAKILHSNELTISSYFMTKIQYLLLRTMTTH